MHTKSVIMCISERQDPSFICLTKAFVASSVMFYLCKIITFFLWLLFLFKKNKQAQTSTDYIYIQNKANADILNSHWKPHRDTNKAMMKDLFSDVLHNIV